ncbi:MAG: InlB B-repeat-containing protein, partial [Thermoguttaceae bacterium]|nr:InlB B-repeat-containing protein [Thermoguttaceae bacterium]
MKNFPNPRRFCDFSPNLTKNFAADVLRAGFAIASDCGEPETGDLLAGDYYVRVSETATHKAGEAATVNVPENLGEFVVTYDSNGGTGGVPVDEGVYKGGESATVRGNTGGPSGGPLARAGYSFTLWNTQADGQGADYRPGESLTFVDRDVALYAQWAGKTIKMTWNSQGGSAVPDTSKTYTERAKVAMPESDPAREDYVFDGWFTDPSG